MAYRCIVIERDARISLQNSQLLVRTEEEHSVPVEDLSALLVESKRSTITTAALSFLGQCGCAVYFCDEKHLPCAVLTPFQQHSRALSVLKLQMAATEPQKKRLWQQVVQAKIRNQARCLCLAEKETAAEELTRLAERVHSGDPENVEATAAQRYFPVLFGERFTRGAENGINAGLNYGYAILRGCIARNLTVYGFLPTFGLHHRSELNAFNLADDLMEPLRPVVDLLVYQTMQETTELTPQIKHTLFNCLNLDVLSGGQRHSVSYAEERLVQSLGKTFAEKGAELLLPELLAPQQHRYE